MAAQNAQISSKFPKGPGDFGLKSSDGVTCYFPKAILGYMSPVFQDMFTLGGGNGKHDSEDIPIIDITEPIVILELFLTQINPKSTKPPIDKVTIEPLLAMAHKYQTDVIFDWFEQEALDSRLSVSPDHKTFVISEPIVALSLAIRYDLQNIGLLALKEACEYSSQHLLEEVHRLGMPAFIAIAQIRQKRIQRYQTYIDGMAKARGPGWQRTHNTQPQFFFTNSSWVAACHTCVIQRVFWMTEIMKAVQLKPVWSSFIQAFESDNSKHCFAWSHHFEDWIPSWKAEALAEESKLPEWPTLALP